MVFVIAAYDRLLALIAICVVEKDVQSIKAALRDEDRDRAAAIRIRQTRFEP